MWKVIEMLNHLRYTIKFKYPCMYCNHKNKFELVVQEKDFINKEVLAKYLEKIYKRER